MESWCVCVCVFNEPGRVEIAKHFMCLLMFRGKSYEKCRVGKAGEGNRDLNWLRGTPRLSLLILHTKDYVFPFFSGNMKLIMGHFWSTDSSGWKKYSEIRVYFAAKRDYITDPWKLDGRWFSGFCINWSEKIIRKINWENRAMKLFANCAKKQEIIWFTKRSIFIAFMKAKRVFQFAKWLLLK